ncbi:MAG: phosphoribosylpyrophosphate synthetase [Owenweeksia sp.]|nr:phosphoribosylpyrophosphate synthetase [Owenweeksia sp.]
MNNEKNQPDYDTMSQAINGLRQRGYSEDLNLKPHCLECASSKLELHPEDFEIDVYYRFEGMSNPDDNSIVYAISGKGGIKGVLVDAYGAYSESLSEAMVQKLKVWHH